jgi:hypothetical protein
MQLRDPPTGDGRHGVVSSEVETYLENLLGEARKPLTPFSAVAETVNVLSSRGNSVRNKIVP